MSVGKLGQFDLHKDDWNLYVERLEQYFIVNEVKVNVKVATLITVIGSEAYELMVHLCTPTKPAAKTFDELVSVMKNHLQPKPSVLAERFKFRQRRQMKNECIAEYVAELKKLSKHCDFSGGGLTENLRDQFVCGLASDNMRQRLFAEDDITFERAYKLAVTMEAAEIDAAAVESRSEGPSSSAGIYQLTPARNREIKNDRFSRNDKKVKEVKQLTRGARVATDSRTGGASAADRRERRENDSGDGYRREQKMTDRQQSECRVCGGKHDPSTCKFRMYVCRICNKEGHLKRKCPRLTGGAASWAVYNNSIEGITDGSSSEESDEFQIC